MQPAFEDRHGRIARRMHRFARALRWRAKGLLGQPRTILVEFNWRLGDEIMALPVLDALRARYPDATIAVLSNYPELFENNPVVHAVNPDKVSPDRYLLLRGASRRVNRLEACCERAGVMPPATRPRLHFIQWDTAQWAALPEGDGPLVALAPGASWPSKRWPADRWNALAGRLVDYGCRVIVLGQAGEGLMCGRDFTGATSIREAACLLHAADLAVTCDSGLMHLALAAGTPAVALFGPTEPDFIVRGEPMLTPLRSTQSCQGFWNRTARVGGPGVCPEGHACCLESITVDEVLDAIRARLPGRGAG